MNKLLILSVIGLMLPIVPALACFPNSDSEKVLFASEGRNFDRSPIPMSFCELPEPGFVVVNGKCYDFDAITDFETEEECQADEVCKAYREQQEQEQDDYLRCPADGGAGCEELKSIEEQEYEQNQDRTDDPNHGEIKGDEELEDEEEHQEEEEQGQEQGESEETTAETSE